MKLVIAGATGLVGSAVIEQIGGRTGVEIIGLSRRGRDDASGVRYVGVDLTRPDGAQSITGDLAGATHLVFAAVDERPDALLDAWRGATEHAATNGSMLGGLLDVLSRVAPDLEQSCCCTAPRLTAPIWAPLTCRRERAIHGCSFQDSTRCSTTSSVDTWRGTAERGPY